MRQRLIMRSPGKKFVWQFLPHRMDEVREKSFSSLLCHFREIHLAHWIAADKTEQIQLC